MKQHRTRRGGRAARLVAMSLATICALFIATLCALQWLPPRWLGARVAALVSARSGYDIAIGALDLDVLTLAPSARAASVRIDGAELSGLADVDRVDVAIDLLALLHGALVLERLEVHGALVELRRDAVGRTSWTPRTTGAGSTAPPVEPAPGRRRLPTVRRVELTGVELALVDAASGTEGRLTLSANGSTGDGAGSWRATLDGRVNGVGVAGDVSLSSLETLLDPDRTAAFTATLEVGGARLRLDGTLAEAATLAGLALDVDASVPDPHELSALLPPASSPPPGTPALAVTGHLVRDGVFWSLEHVRGTFGHTSFDGDVRLDPASSPPTLYANLAAETLDLDELAALGGSRATRPPERDATADPTRDDLAPAVPTGASPPLSRTPLGVAPLLDRVHGALHLRAARVVSAALPVESFDVRVRLSARGLSADPLVLGLAGGRLEGTLTLARATHRDPEAVDATLEATLTGLRLGRLIAREGLADDASGRLGAELKYWAGGASVAELAASLDGGAFVVLRDGTIDQLLPDAAALELLGVAEDVITPWKDMRPLRCGYLDTHSERGLTVLDRLVIDTQDALILGRGSVDLGDGSLDVTLEPHSKPPRIPGGQISLDIGGTLARPSVGAGTAEPLPVAMEAVLAEVATQVLTLVPLLGRDAGPESPWCATLGEVLDVR